MYFTNKIATFKQQPFWLIIALLHITLMVVLYYQFGFNYQNEGAKYVLQANDIINGNYDWNFNYNSFYLTYILYIAGLLSCKTPLYIICLSTYLLSIYAYYNFYKMLKNLLTVSVAKIWICCMLLSPMLQYWHFNLFSESFYIALSLIYISFAFKTPALLNFIKLLLMGPFLCLARPNAILAISTIATKYLYKYNTYAKSLNTILLSLYLTMVLIVVFYFLPLPYKDFTVQLTEGAIYCGFPTLPHTSLPEGKYTLWNVYQYIYNNYGLETLMELFLKKLGSFFVTSRPYYSNLHNIINDIHGISYVLCIIPFFKWKTYNQEVRYFIVTLASIIILNALMVGLIYNEWSERHTIQIFPFIFVGVAMAISTTYKYYIKQSHSKTIKE